MNLQQFLWQFLLLGATTAFGILAEWARRMLPDPRRDDEDKPRKLHRIRAADSTSEAELDTDDSDT